MIHYGDITKIHGDQVPAVHVITGGSPCQDLSVAGKRAGLAGERSGLFMEQIRIVKEMRENDRRNYAGADNADRLIRPRFMVWENVPGAFSSNKGEDFRAVLEETAKVADKDAVIPGPPKGKWTPAGCIMGDGWSIAWRVHDAQFWGVPQRRKRIALVADFGGECAPEILFERESVSGDTEKSGKEGQEAAGDAGAGTEETGGAISFQERAGCPGGGKGILIQNERTGALSTLNNQPVCFEPGAMSRVGGHAYEDDVAGTVRANAGDNQQAVCLNSWDVQSKHIQPENGIAESLYAGECRGGGGESYVMQSKVYGISSYDSNGMKSDNPNSGIYEADTSRTLDNNGGNPACNQEGMVVLEGNGSRPSHQGDEYAESETMYTLNSTEHHAVCIENHPADSRVKIADDGKVQTLSGRMGTGGGNVPMVMEPILLESNQNHATIQTDGVSTALPASMGMGGGYVPMVMDMLNLNPKQDNICQTLNAFNGTGGNNMPLVMYSIAVESHAQDARYNVGDINQPLSANIEHDPANGGLVMQSINGDIAGTLDASYYKGCGERQGRERTVVAMTTEMTPKIDEKNKGFSLRSRDYKDPQCVAYGIDSYNQTASKEITESLRSADGGDSKPKVCARISAGTSNQLASDDMFVANTSIVRRLTPLECTRLQGFPDGWVDIGEWVDSKGKVRKDSDANKYKALGNSIALPFWEWMAERMMPYLPENPTMASLFSGIGGFELVFSRAGCKPVWASEVEDFAIAVTKRRFPEE